MLDFIIDNKAILAVLILGITATILFFYQLSSKSVPKIPCLLKGSNNTSMVILESKKMINHDTMLLKMKLPGDNLVLGLNVGQHIRIYGKDKDGKQIVRPYTPISKVNKKGSFDLLIKVYFPCEKFPQGGQMTQYLHSLPERSRVRISGPNGMLKFKGDKKFQIGNKIKKFTKISLVGGGSGITPLYQVITHLLDESPNKYTISLLYANKTEKDILLREELDNLKNSKKINLFYTLDNPSENWKGFKGFVNKDMIKEFPDASDDHLILVCGPIPMQNDIEKITQQLGYNDSNVYFF